MTRTKSNAAEWIAVLRALAARQASHNALRRGLCDHLQFWMMCPDAPCRRHRRCSGDVHACFRDNWALMPEDEKALIRAEIEAEASELPW